MRVTVLVENKAMGEGVKHAHGLSLYVETDEHTILFDFGPRGDLLLENAAILGADMKKVDVAVLSHGHNDHSGGLETFLSVNDRARVYIHRRAFLPHFSNTGDGYADISADPRLRELLGDRLVWTEDIHPIDDSLLLFSDVEALMPLLETNRTLFELRGTNYVRDDFLHEQNLLIRENGKTALFGGCAHRGLVNILHRAIELEGRAPDAVFAGCHLTNPGLGEDAPDAVVSEVGDRLAAWPCIYYTGHCTGEGPYRILAEQLGSQVTYMGCGRSFTVE